MARVAQVCFVLQEADLVLLARASGGRRSVASIALDAAVALLCVVRCKVCCCTARACLPRQAWLLCKGAVSWASRRCCLRACARRAACVPAPCCKFACGRRRSVVNTQLGKPNKWACGRRALCRVD